MFDEQRIDRRQLLAGAGLAALGAGGLTALAGCGRGGGPAPAGPSGGAPRRGGTLRVGALGKRSSLERDPHETLANESDFLIASLVFEALTVPGRRIVSPRAASSWQASADLRRLDLRLADGARFHDGRLVTADDVVWSLRRLRATKSGASRLPGIRPEAIRRTSARSVSLTSDMPNADLALLLRLNTFVLPAGTEDPAAAPGSGPFRLVSYRDGDAVLRRNDDWHGGTALLDEIHVTLFEEASAMTEAVLGGQIDVASNAGPVAARLAQARAGVEIVRRRNDMAMPIVMRISDGPFADARVRRAVRLAVDRPAMVEGALSGFGSVANDVLGVGDPAYAKDLPQRERDLGEARRLLAAAGFDTRRTYELRTTPEVPGLADSAVLFASQVRDAGLRLEVVREDGAAFYDETWLQAPLYTTYWGTNDSVGFFLGKTMRSDANWNETAWKSDRLDALYARSAGARDAQARRTALRAAQRLQYEEGGYVVWGMADGIDLAAPTVRDLPTLPGYGRVFLERTWLAA